MSHSSIPPSLPERDASRRVTLEAGSLTLRVSRAEMPLDELCDFASRRNRKRGYLFVSKVLGKHYPVRPAVMDDVHARLASKFVDVRGPVVVIGLAETATGLGHGVYEHLLRSTNREDALFLHTTRYRLRRPLALEFFEPHSHAPQHLLYQPDDAEHRRLFQRAATLVLVDDELSTGVTLANLARAYRERNPHLRATHVVSLTNWLPPRREAEFAATAGIPTHFHNLLRGEFRFEPSASFQPDVEPPLTEDEFLDEQLPDNFGRLGMMGPLEAPQIDATAVKSIPRGGRVLVLGTGEFNYAPFLLARALEARGFDVRFQSTTRSPILLGGAIASFLPFPDNYTGTVPNFVYNVVDRQYDRIMIGYETAALPTAHELPQQVKGEAIFFRKTHDMGVSGIPGEWTA